MTPHPAVPDSMQLDGPAPPAGLGPALQALWWDASGDWIKAHDAVAEASGSDAAWVHGYLHRREGDEGNAAYWYRRAGQPRASDALDDEWTRIVSTLLGRV